MKRYLLLALLLIQLPGLAQTTGDRKVKQIFATVGVAPDQLSLAGQYTHQWKIGKAQRFSLGWGARFTTYFASNQYYATAPAELTSESTSPLIFFTEVIEANMDSFRIASPRVYACNLSIDMRYQLGKKLAIGFSIDAIGFSVGPKKTGTHINGAPTGTNGARPSPFNLLLISDNDRGSLNSELYAAYPLNNKIGIKAGWQFLFTEYTTDTNVQTEPKENDRFRRKSLLFTVGIVFQL